MKECICVEFKGGTSESKAKEILNRVEQGERILPGVKSVTIYRSTDDNISFERLKKEFTDKRAYKRYY